MATLGPSFDNAMQPPNQVRRGAVVSSRFPGNGDAGEAQTVAATGHAENTQIIRA